MADQSSKSSSTSPPTVVTKIRPQPGPQETFLANSADICVYGGAAGGGKTWALLLEPLRHIQKPGFGAVIFRRTYPQITQQGGLWDQSTKLYPLIGATPRQSEVEWRFRQGTRIKFAHLQHDKNVFDWQGSELPLICFDELTHFTESQFWYLLSRNRSLCGVRPYIRATCNPDADSWVATLLSWWIDPNSGIPIPERAGKVRWFVRANDQLVWGDSQHELAEKHPEIPPKSLSFVPAKLSDNPALMSADPGYLASLLALPLVERERLLGGNWKIRPASGLVFNRAWFQFVDAAPSQATRVRYWDKASTPGAGDWSVGVRMAKAGGLYFVEDVIRGQWSSGERNQVMQQTAALDGSSVQIWVEQEPGSGGKESAAISIKELAGYSVHAEPVTGDKLSRARAFSAQCEAGNVRLVRNLSRDWCGCYLDELHAFPESLHDDQVDASSGAFNKLVLASVEWGKVQEHAPSRSLFADAPEGVFLS